MAFAAAAAAAAAFFPGAEHAGGTGRTLHMKELSLSPCCTIFYIFFFFLCFYGLTRFGYKTTASDVI